MLSVALSRLVLICNFFEETCTIFLPTSQLAFTRSTSNFTTHIYFHLDDSARQKQYQYVNQEMMEQTCDLETVKQQEVPIKVCVIFYNVEICCRVCGEKHKFSCSHQRCSLKKVILRNFAKFTGKHLYQSLFFNKVARIMPTTLLKKRLRHRCFFVYFAKFLRTPF